MIMIEKMSYYMGKIAKKLNENKYVTTIKLSFVSIVGFTIVGSVGTLMGTVILSSTGLGGVNGFEGLQVLVPWFNQLTYATINILSLLVAFNVGKNLAQQFGREGIHEGLLSLVCFILVSPTSVTTVVNNQSIVVNNVLSTDVTSSKGLFVAMIVGMISVTLFCKLANMSKLKISLPESVPPMVGKTFVSLIPTIIVTLLVSGFAFVFELLSGMNLLSFIYTVLQAPISIAFQHPLGIVFCAILGSLFWFCGIHCSIVTGIISPIMLGALQVNMGLVSSGQEPTEIVVRPFWNLYVTMGGFGCTLALLIAIFLVSKRSDDKAIAKLSLGPAFFGINEPILFGLPVVLNPIMLIPFVLCPAICASIGYASIYFGISAKIISEIPWVLPPLINGFVATGGDIMTVITQIVCIVISVLIWIPFVKMRNNEVEAEMKEGEFLNGKETC